MQAMWISSFVATFASDAAAQVAVAALAAVPVFTLGDRQGLRLPVVVEAPDGSTSRYWYEWVEQLPGVVQLEVAFVSFEETDSLVGTLTTAAGE